MKELLTKKFWREVKKTFEDAQKEEPLERKAPPLMLDHPADSPSSVSDDVQKSGAD